MTTTRPEIVAVRPSDFIGEGSAYVVRGEFHVDLTGTTGRYTDGGVLFYDFAAAEAFADSMREATR